MKKLMLVTAALLLVYPVVSAAQDWKEKRHSFSLTAGFAPATQDMESYDWFTSYDRWWREWNIHDIYNHYGHNDAVYLGEMKTSGAISLTYGYQVLRWIRFNVTATHTGFYRKLYKYEDGLQFKNISRHYFYVMPGLTFTYVNKPVVRLYSGFNIGVGFVVTKDNDYDDNKMFVGGQVIGIGIEVGRKWYGKAEAGFGMKGLISGGFGYRF